MPINVNTTPQQIGVTVGETQIDVSVGGGVGPTGNSGTVAVSAPITNAGTSTAANIGLSVGTGLAVSGGSLVVTYGTTSTSACRGDDARLTDAREWSAATVSQADAEAGTSTSRFAFTPQRVFQAIAAWWAGSAAKTKLDGIAVGATANATDAQLRDRATHTGTQLAATISDFASAVVAAAPPTTNASLLTSGTLPDARLSSNIARTSDVSSAVAAVVNAAPATLDTLAELAAALGSDANFSTTVTNALAAKAPIASPTFTGTVSGITKAMVGLGNVPNVDATARANHTGTQTASTISDFTAAVVAAAPPTTDASLLTTGTLSASRLPSTTVAAGSYGSASSVGTFTVGADGRLTAAGSSSIGIAAGAVSGLAAIATSGSASDLGAGTVPFARLPVGTSSTTVAAGDDARFTDARTPTAHVHSGADITSGTVAAARLGSGTADSTTFLRGDGSWAAAGSTNASDLTSGTLNIARLPAHASTHQTGGADAINPVIVTPASLSASQNDYAPGTADIIRLSSSTAVDITGLLSPSVDGALRLIINTNASGGAAITLKHESASSTAANRLRNAAGGDYVLAADGGSALLTYSTAISRWRIL